MENNNTSEVVKESNEEENTISSFRQQVNQERLEAYCKFNGYNIVEYYEDAGISAKTGNHRPEYERMLEDGKNGTYIYDACNDKSLYESTINAKEIKEQLHNNLRGEMTLVLKINKSKKQKENKYKKSL